MIDKKFDKTDFDFGKVFNSSHLNHIFNPNFIFIAIR